MIYYPAGDLITGWHFEEALYLHGDPGNDQIQRQNSHLMETNQVPSLFVFGGPSALIVLPHKDLFLGQVPNHWDISQQKT